MFIKQFDIVRLKNVRFISIVLAKSFNLIPMSRKSTDFFQSVRIFPTAFVWIFEKVIWEHCVGVQIEQHYGSRRMCSQPIGVHRQQIKSALWWHKGSRNGSNLRCTDSHLLPFLLQQHNRVVKMKTWQQFFGWDTASFKYAPLSTRFWWCLVRTPLI